MGYFTNPNHFVNQGYDNISFPVLTSPQNLARMIPATQFQIQQMGGTRLIPIQMEALADNGGFTMKGPLSATPPIIQKYALIKL